MNVEGHVRRSTKEVMIKDRGNISIKRKTGFIDIEMIKGLGSRLDRK
jgi:hypothetical protein